MWRQSIDNHDSMSYTTSIRSWCALFCCDVSSIIKFMWFVNSYPSELLHWHWEITWRIWVKNQTMTKYNKMQFTCTLLWMYSVYITWSSVQAVKAKTFSRPAELCDLEAINYVTRSQWIQEVLLIGSRKLSRDWCINPTYNPMASMKYNHKTKRMYLFSASTYITWLPKSINLQDISLYICFYF